MDSRKIVIKETGIVALGVAVCLVIMYGVFAVLGSFDVHVLIGGILGAILTVLNFFFMAVSVNSAADKAADQDVKGGKRQVKLSYATRMLAIFLILLAFVKSGVAHPLASVLPLAFVWPVVTVTEFFRKK